MRIQHRIPEYDVFHHEESENCPCGPEKQVKMESEPVIYTVWWHQLLWGRD